METNLISGQARGLSGLIDALRTRPSLAAQGTRFVISGCVVSIVYLGVTTVLATLLALPFEVALAAGFVAAAAVHFSLQRRFVWAHHEQFALSLRGQLRRYLPLTGAQYGLTALSTSLLPLWLGISTEIVYLATALSITSVNFMLFRRGVFHDEVRE